MVVRGKKRKTVFILGAGASRAAIPHVLLNRKRIKAPLNSDFFTIAQTYVRARGAKSSDGKRLSRLRRFFKEALPVKGMPTMEDAFTLLYMAKDFPAIYGTGPGRRASAGYRREIEDFLRLAFGIFATLDSQSNRRTWYDNLVERFTPEDTVITLNYDTLMDSALVRHGWDPRCGYCLTGGRKKVEWKPARSISAPTAQDVDLLKLHGSVNWYVRGSFSDLARIFICKPVSVKNPRMREVREHIRQIVPPMYAKFFAHDHWRALWDRAYKALRECEILVVLGCSLIDTDFHLRALLSRVREVRKKGALFRTAVFVDPDVKVRRKWSNALSGSIRKRYDFNGLGKFLKRFKT